MSFNETEVNRDQGGRFDHKTGSPAEVTLWAEGTPGRFAHDPEYVHAPGRYAGYEVKNFRSLPIGSEGGAFTASIYREGKRVMTVENDGNGGMDTFTDLSGEHPTRHRGPELTRFAQAGRRMFPDTYEADSEMVQFVLWAKDVDNAVGTAPPEKRQAFLDEVAQAGKEMEAEGAGYSIPERWMSAAADPSTISKLAED